MDARQLGARLAEARRAAGYSQREVAAVLGCHHPTIVWMEQGKRRVSFLEAVQLARLYGISITALAETASQSQGTPLGLGEPLLQSATEPMPTR